MTNDESNPKFQIRNAPKTCFEFRYSNFVILAAFSGELPGLDSNQDKENQNLLCYRYTTG